MIVDSVYSFLAANAGIAALCQSIYPQLAPQPITGDMITYSLDSDETYPLFDGVGSLREARVSVEAWSLDHLRAHQIGDAIESALDGYRGAFGSKTADHVRLERKFELFESDSKLYRVSQQFVLAYY